MKLITANCFLLAVLFHVAENQIQYDRHVTMKPDVFKLSWYYTANKTIFYFRIEAKTTGWVALGLTTGDGKNMMNLDIALGGVMANGNAYLKVTTPNYWGTVIS